MVKGTAQQTHIDSPNINKMRFILCAVIIQKGYWLWQL